jgi:ABC-type sugar transport system ATPase subunit
MLPARVAANGRPTLVAGPELPLEVSGVGEVIIGVRPEHLTLAPTATRHTLAGRALIVERLGSDSFVHVAISAQAERVIVRLAGDGAVTTGMDVHIELDPATLHLFDAAGRRMATRIAADALA